MSLLCATRFGSFDELVTLLLDALDEGWDERSLIDLVRALQRATLRRRGA